MIKPLPSILYIAQQNNQRKSSRLQSVIGLFCFINIFLVAANTCHAQVIFETFEENGTTSTVMGSKGATMTVALTSSSYTSEISGTTDYTSLASSSKTSSTRGAGANTSKSTSTLCSYTTQGSSSETTTSSTLGADSLATFTWYYGASAANKMTIKSSTSGFHSNSDYLAMASTSLLITPIVPQGITSVSFWVDGAVGSVAVGVRTTTTTTAASSSNQTTSYPYNSTGMSNEFSNISIFATSGVPYTTYTHSSYYKTNWLSNSSTVAATTTSGATKNSTWSIYQIAYSVPTSLQGSPCQIVIAANGATVNIDDIEIFGTIVPYTWTGNISTDWNNASNWTYNQLPTTTSNVIIPKVTNQPILSTDITVKSINLKNLATLSINGHALDITDSIAGTGKYIGSATSSLELGGNTNGSFYFTSPGLLNNLTIDDGASDTLASALTIASTGTLTVGTINGADLATGGFLTLAADNNGSATVAQIPVVGGVSQSIISGNVNVQCYIHSNLSSVPGARRAWRLLTAPVTNSGASPTCTIYSGWQNGGTYSAGVGTMITGPSPSGSNGLDAGINGAYSAYTWNVSSQKLVGVGNTKTGISGNTGNADNTGYFIFIRGDRNPATVTVPSFATYNNTTLSCSAPLQVGDQTFTGSTGALSTALNGLSLIGNPFASSVDFSYVAGDDGLGSEDTYGGLVNITNRFYFWNANLAGSNGVGGYVCVDDAAYTGTYTETLGNSGVAPTADINIQSGQAIFVQTTSAGPDTVDIQEAAKSAVTNYIYRPSNYSHRPASTTNHQPIESFSATLSLLNSDYTTSLTDGIVAQFKNGYCNCVDNIDAPKFTNSSEMFSLARNGQQLCIERRPEIGSSDTLFLNLKQMSQRPYQFKYTTAVTNHPGLGARLEDNYTGTKTALNLQGTDTLDFTVDATAASQDVNRFKVVFGALNIVPAYLNISATQLSNTNLVQWSLSNDQSMTAYIVQRSTDSGITYTTVDTIIAAHTNGIYHWVDLNPPAGKTYYRVMSTDVLNEEAYSPAVYADIKSIDSSASIKIFPNPIQNGQMNIALDNMPAGEYHYSISNLLGLQVQSGSFIHQGGNATENIQFTKTLAKGTYHVEVFHPDQAISVIDVIN
jgi:hypothetical protein